MNTMRVMVGVLLGALAACAHTEQAEPVAMEATQVPHGGWPLSVQGVITIDELRPRSDIVILPPAIEHVVWIRGVDTSRFDGVEVGRAEVPTRAETGEKAPTGPARRIAEEEWPLLAEDMNFDSEIGRVRMCLADGAYDPCEHPERYRCYGSKAGGYCLEAAK